MCYCKLPQCLWRKNVPTVGVLITYSKVAEALLIGKIGRDRLGRFLVTLVLNRKEFVFQGE